MKTFSVAAMIAVFLLGTAIGIQAQNQSAINPKVDVKHLQGSTMLESGQGFDENMGFKDNQMPQGFEKNGNLKTKKEKQFRSEMAGTQLLDSTITVTWDTLTNQWINSNKVEYTYFGNLTFSRDFWWSGQWVEYSPKQYTYDSKGNMTENVFFVRCGERDCNYINVQTTYDTKGNIILFTEYTRHDTTNQWDVNRKEESSYDTNGKKISFISYYWNHSANQWFAHYKEEFAYDTNGNIISLIQYLWIDSTIQWEADRKEEFTNDAFGNLTLYIAFKWNDIANQWDAYHKKESKYDSNGKTISFIRYQWNDSTIQWDAFDKQESTYDTNGKTISQIEYDWDSKTKLLVYRYKNEYNYNTSGNLILELYYYWDVISNKWIVSGKNVNTYDTNGNINSWSNYVWDKIQNQWVRHSYDKTETSYDSNGNIILSIFYQGIDQLIPSLKYEYAYDANFNKTLFIISNWDDFTKQWIINVKIKTTYYYSDHSITNTPKTPETQLQVYPNPAKEFIVFDLSTARESTITIYDLQGRKVIEQRLNESHQVSVQNLPKGLYLYRLEDGMTIYTGKVIKE